MSPEEIKKITDAAKVLMNALNDKNNGMIDLYNYGEGCASLALMCDVDFLFENFIEDEHRYTRASNGNVFDKLSVVVDGVIFYALTSKK